MQHYETTSVADTAGPRHALSDGRKALIGVVGVRPNARGWRDALLRRLLAAADVLAATIGVTMGAWYGGSLSQVAWGMAFVPAWVVLAKVLGLYDADQRSLRHLTVDECPRLAVWAFTGTVILALLAGI